MAAENLRPILGSGNGVDASIQHWQADTSLGKAYGVATGPIGLLFNSILEFLGLVLVDMKTQSTIPAHYQPLETISATLFFWGTDLEVTQGELDESLRDSTELRDTCLMVLISIGQYLTCCESMISSLG